eukprot:COSAG01_NODE_50074_length_366_cov_2.119850_1_plen_30_part_01
MKVPIAHLLRHAAASATMVSNGTSEYLRAS